MKLVLSTAIISKISTLADRSVRIWLDLPEADPKELSEIISCLQNGTHEIETDIDEGESKSPAQRLRGNIYVLWEQQQQAKYPEFEVYYRVKMTEFINQIKEKLN